MHHFRILPRTVLAVVLGIVISGCAAHRAAVAPLPPEGSATGFLSMSAQIEDKNYPAVLYVPREYDPSEQWPLVVFLHGAGERGDGGLDQVRVGIGPAIMRNPERFPCLVLMPQCPAGAVWSMPDTGRFADAEDSTAIIDAALGRVLDEYSVDPDRVSLTGLSLGGFGTFRYGADNVERFSAFMPVCGGGNPDDAAVLAQRPMWVFHGADDPVVNADLSRTMVEAIKEAGGDVRLTIYPETGHNSWDKAYAEKDAIEWLLSQERP